MICKSLLVRIQAAYKLESLARKITRIVKHNWGWNTVVSSKNKIIIQVVSAQARAILQALTLKVDNNRSFKIRTRLNTIPAPKTFLVAAMEELHQRFRKAALNLIVKSHLLAWLRHQAVVVIAIR